MDSNGRTYLQLAFVERHDRRLQRRVAHVHEGDQPWLLGWLRQIGFVDAIAERN